jgi:organic radical activating enzyme
MSDEATLSLSENFYSVQCEGVSTGYPAYFIRLKGCNLMCGGKGGSLMKEGKATWWCDSEAVWRQGQKTSIETLIADWEEEDILDWVLEGRVHLIWTGGEPTLSKHQKDIVKCIQYLNDKYGAVTHDMGGIQRPELSLYNEIETNGTQYIEDELFDRLDQINCSVKLANSGHTYVDRHQAGPLRRIMEHPNYWFKFVISEEDDMDEITRDFIEPLKIPPHKVLMMPGLDHQDNFHERTEFCLQMAKKYGYVGLTRLHISAWNQTTGV